MKKSLLLFFFIIQTQYAQFFSHLSEIKKYADSMPEYIETENNDWVHPDFSQFHKKNAIGWIDSILQKIGFARSEWNGKEFKDLVKKITRARELSGFIGAFIQHVAPHSEDKFLIWGDLFGAFHSLVRDLENLHSLGILGDDLKIQDDHYYFVFNGNLISYSSYILETCTVVLRLMEANPERVIYTRGSHEDKQRWHSFGLSKELEIRARNLSNEQIPLNKLMTRFFNTLPLGFFVTQTTANAIDTVLIGNNEYVNKEFDVKSFGGFLDEQNNSGLHVFKLSNKKTTNKEVRIRAIITGEDRDINYHQTEGLTLLGTRKEATAWIVFSSPTGRNRRLYEFFYDAFAQMTIHKQFKDWTITLFNQDVRSLLGFNEAITYNLVTGQKLKETTATTTAAQAEPLVSTKPEPQEAPPSKEPEKTIQQPVEEKEFVFGSTMDLSKGASPIGKQVREGLQARFDKERMEDEISSIVPKLITVDDEYTPRKTREAVEHLLKDLGIDILIGSQGSASLESYLDLIKAGKVLVLFPYTGAPIFRDPSLKYIINYRGSYVREGEELIDYALKDLQSKKIAIFYQNDAFGKGALEGAVDVLKKAGVPKADYIEVPHERNNVDFTQQAKQIKDFNPDTILFSTNALAIRGLIRQMGVQYFAGKKLLGVSVYEEAFEQFLKDKGLTFVLARMVPDPRTSKLEIVKDYREWADKKNMSYDKVSLEMFISASILFEILKHLQPPITKEKIIAAAEQMKDYPFKGLLLDFDPKTRELSDTLWIDPGNGAPWIAKPKKRSGAQTTVSQKEETQKAQSESITMPGQKAAAIKDLKLGSTIDLSKGIRVQGREVKSGLEARLEESKMQGKPTPELIIMDDEYTPSVTIEDVNKFLKEGIDIIIGSVGSQTLAAYLDKVKKKEVLVLFPITGAPLFRDPALEYMVHFRAPYDAEGKVLTEYAIDTLKTNKAAIFYQNDAFGQGLLDAAKKVLQERGITNWIEVSYDRNNVDFEHQVKVLQKENPDAILFFSTTSAAQELIRQLGISNIITKKLLGNSDFSESKFKAFEKEKGLDFVYLNVVPNPETSNLEIVKQYRNEMNKEQLALDAFSLESYIGMDILLSVLATIQPPYTKERVLEALEQIKDYNYKGLKLNFDPQTRSLAKMLWIDSGNPDWELVEV